MDLDVAAVRLAGAHYLAEGHRLSAAKSSLGLNSTAFYAVVNRAIDDPAVMLAEPEVCARLRRIRDGQRARRFAGRRLAA